MPGFHRPSSHTGYFSTCWLLVKWPRHPSYGSLASFVSRILNPGTPRKVQEFQEFQEFQEADPTALGGLGLAEL